VGQGEDSRDFQQQGQGKVNRGGHAAVKMRTKYFPFPAVNYVSELPNPGSKRYMIYIVLKNDGMDRRSGLWHSDSTAWSRLGKVLDLSDLSNPPKGKCKVTNLYVDPETGRLEVEWDDIPGE